MILDKEFSRESFLEFVNNFLPNFGKDIRPVQHSRSFREACSLGSCSELDLQILELVLDGSINKRVSIATEAFKLMKAVGSYKALVVFQSNKEKSWRLSLMTATPTIEEGKIVTRLSNPRRFSYLLGPGAKTVTPFKYLVKQGEVLDFEDLQNRFSVEVVNKEFFGSIAELYTKFVGGKRKKGSKVADYPGMLKISGKENCSNEYQEFAVRLIGRIVFCWFLREKKSANNTPLIPDEVLSLAAVNSNQVYYHKTLEPLFFEILNKKLDKREAPFREKPFSLIPYLNGGLFSPHHDDYYDYSTAIQGGKLGVVDVPDEWLKEFIELLNTYNFTVDENTTYDVDLSVDPEMLGRIFENLLAEINPETGKSARKSTGSYYTPRPIVEYMVDRSLVHYLESKTQVDIRQIEALVSYDLLDDEDSPLSQAEENKILDALSKLTVLDPACGSGAFPIGILQKVVFMLQRIDVEARRWLEKQLLQVTPELRRLLETQYANKNYDYLRKLGVIRESIYGVDIQPIATEIARLRCFLTLIVEEDVDDKENNRGIEPLPNLDFKFVSANSLIRLPDTADKQQQMFEDTEGIEALRKIRNEYFGAANEERAQLQAEFKAVQHDMALKNIDIYKGSASKLSNSLARWEPFEHSAVDWFDSEWMFGVKEFDIIIGNPPYIGQKNNNLLFKPIKQGWLGNFHQRRMDLFYFFFHLALSIGEEHSIISFITTNYYINATYADKLRKDFKKRATILNLINFNELRIFKSAVGQHNMITILRKGKDEETIAKTCITRRNGNANQALLKAIVDCKDEKTDYFQVSQNDLFDDEECYIRITGSSHITGNPVQLLLERIKEQGVALSNICNVNAGVQTGADKVTNNHIKIYDIQARSSEGIFVLTDEEVKSMNLNSNAKDVLKPWFKNSDIHKWQTENSSEEKLIYYTSKSQFDLDPVLAKHFSKYKRLLINRNTRSGTGVITEDDYEKFLNGTKFISYVMIASAFKTGKYYCISYARDQQVFEEPKIVAPQRSPSNTFGYNEIPWYASADVYFITEKDQSLPLKYILALLNSNLYYQWLYHRGKRKGETLELYRKPLSEIPIKKVSDREQRPFVNLVNKMLAITNSENYSQKPEKIAEVEEYEKQIDQMVYKLYGLTDEEIKIVEETIGNKKYENKIN